MATRDELLSIEEAAAALGVSSQQVRRLAEAGELTRLARGVIERASVDRYLRERQGGRTRVWAEATAWAAISMLSGDQPMWLGLTQASRLRSQLRGIDAEDLVVRTRDRAKTMTYSAHPTALIRLRDMVAEVDPSALGVGQTIVEPGRLEGYIDEATLEDAVRSLGLAPSSEGNVFLRATGMEFAVVSDLASRSTALAALDAATSLDPRISGVGLRVLANALAEYQR